jgi:hypothetical protein
VCSKSPLPLINRLIGEPILPARTANQQQQQQYLARYWFTVRAGKIIGSLAKTLRLAVQRKINTYRQQYADNRNISFLPAIVSTSTRMHGEFLRLLFLQAHRETETHFTAAGMSSQRNHSDSFRFKRAAFYQSLKSKVGLAAARAASLMINLNVKGCGILAAPVHAPSRVPLLLPLLLSHNLPVPRVH